MLIYIKTTSMRLFFLNFFTSACRLKDYFTYPGSLNSSLSILLTQDTVLQMCSERTCFIMTDWKRKYRLTQAMNACVGYKQSRIVFYSGCWCSTLVCIDQVVRVFCSLNHCVSISPSIHGHLHHQHGVITGWYGSLHFLSQQQQQQRGKKGLLFFVFFVRACVHTWLVGWWLCMRQHNMSFLHK